MTEGRLDSPNSSTSLRLNRGLGLGEKDPKDRPLRHSASSVLTGEASKTDRYNVGEALREDPSETVWGGAAGAERHIIMIRKIQYRPI